MFKSKEHEAAYKEFILKAHVSDGDAERKSLFYLLSLLEDTREHINDLYDFKENWIKPEGLNKGWQTGGTTKITMLAFNLYNGFNDEDNDYSPLNLFSGVDSSNREYLLQSIRIRFS